MSTYYSIGCEKCREQVDFVSDGGAGVNLMGGADKELALFMEKHMRRGCTDQLRIFNEHDYRYDDFTDFDPSAKWDIEP